MNMETGDTKIDGYEIVHTMGALLIQSLFAFLHDLNGYVYQQE